MIFFLKMVIKPVSTATVTEGIDQQFTVKRHLNFFTLCRGIQLLMQCAIWLFQQYTTVNCKKVTKIYFSTQETAISTFKTVSAIPCSAQFRLFRYYFTFQILKKYFFSKYFSWGLNRNGIPSFKSIRSHFTTSAEPRKLPPEAVFIGRPDVLGVLRTC